MASNKEKSSRQFLWGDDDSGVKNRGAGTTNLSGARFSTRDYAVDQSVNLMDMGDQPSSTGRASASGSGLASSVAGLFRGSATAQTGGGSRFDEYGDAAPSTESEEYISGKRRRITPIGASLKNALNTCVDSCAIACGRARPLVLCLSVVGFLLVVAGIFMMLSGGSSSDTESDIKSLIIEKGLSSKSDFGGIRTNARKKALKWLTTGDPAKLGVGDDAVLDRYALAVFYYGTDGNWDNQDKWLSGAGHCSWYGVECTPRSQEPTEANNFQPTTTSYDANDVVIGLMLAGNSIQGSIPSEITKLPLFISLDLSNNEMSGDIPESIGEAPSLRNLLLRKNSFVGSFPIQVTTLQNLHQLHLGENRFAGSLPGHLDDLAELRVLGLGGNSFTGTLPNLTPLTRLIDLYLEDNDLSGTIPDWLPFLTELTSLRLNTNKFSGPLSSPLDALKNLEVLHLHENRFTGTVPDMFDHTPRISNLQLQDNSFNGPLPHTIWHLQDLKHLTAENNDLTGHIHENIALLPDVEVIRFSSNQFSGTIPTNLGVLDDIVHLALDNNMLNGTIPTELGGCYRLEQLDLNNNQLTGEIPSEIGNLNRLQRLRLEENLFEGVSVPPLVCKLEKDDLSHLSADCNEKVTCDCCSECS